MRRDYWKSCPVCRAQFRGASLEEVETMIENHIRAGHPEMTGIEAKPQGEKKSFEGKGALVPVIYEADKGEVAPKELELKAIEYARAVGLRPELGHVCLYHGRPWVTIDGWLYRFRKKFPLGLILSRPLSEEERKTIGIDEKTHAWVCEVYEHEGGRLLSRAYGYAREGEEPLARGSAVEPRWPWAMARKRAMEDALREVVPLEIERGE